MATTAPDNASDGQKLIEARLIHCRDPRQTRSENPRLFTSPEVVDFIANAAPDRQSAMAIVHIDR